MFQSTHPHGVRHENKTKLKGVRGFNPRTHTGCDGSKSPTDELKKVSIHAPTRGATNANYNLKRERLFQSTHPHGVRHSSKRGSIIQSSFNPRTHTGCDMQESKGFILQGVSIHAPTRGATAACTDTTTTDQFQSTHPHGVRLRNTLVSYWTIKFQSTHPHGVRLALRPLSFTVFMFQSTHPHGVRHEEIAVQNGMTEFQSTHPHGVRHAFAYSLR